MKIKELIDKLNEKLIESGDEDLEVSFTYSTRPNCNCTQYGGYCYCSYEEHKDKIYYVSLTKDTKEIILGC